MLHVCPSLEFRFIRGLLEYCSVEELCTIRYEIIQAWTINWWWLFLYDDTITVCCRIARQCIYVATTDRSLGELICDRAHEVMSKGMTLKSIFFNFVQRLMHYCITYEVHVLI